MGKKGGSQTTEVKLPPAIEQAAKQNLDIANEVAAIGPSMFSGPSIAGFNPQQLAAMQGIDQAAAAFGMPSAIDWQQQAGGSMSAPRGMDQDALYTALTGMPPPNASAGGFSGYSGLPIAQAAYNALPAAQRAALESFTMNPVTGEAPTNMSVPTPKTSFTNGQVGQGRGMGPTVFGQAMTPELWRKQQAMKNKGGR